MQAVVTLLFTLQTDSLESVVLHSLPHYQIKQKEKEMRILILGLDNAGKTTVMRKFCGQPIDQIQPTLGFTIQTLEYTLVSDSDKGGAAGAINDDKAVVHAAEKYQGDADTAGNGKDNAPKNNSTTAHAAAGDYAYSSSSQQKKYTLNLWDVGGQKSIRAYWRNYFEQTDGLIWVVDSSDRMRLDLCRQELAQLLSQERLAGASLLILANKQDVDGALAASEIVEILELDTADRFRNRHWSIHGCSAVTGRGISEAMEWMVRDIRNRIFMLD